jgi:hypothetical protein
VVGAVIAGFPSLGTCAPAADAQSRASDAAECNRCTNLFQLPAMVRTPEVVEVTCVGATRSVTV